MFGKQPAKSARWDVKPSSAVLVANEANAVGFGATKDSEIGAEGDQLFAHRCAIEIGVMTVLDAVPHNSDVEGAE